ncbi:Integrase core domain containing protein [Aphelenchoides avenae]|nr:Integrase core domain containing protein [Aphelenchus avenae]
MSLRERMQNLHAQGHTADVRPQLDEVVLIRKPDLKQFFWPTGRIVGLNESHDDEIRTAEVQLPNGNTITRSLQHLYPLEINARDDEALPAVECKPLDDPPRSLRPGELEEEAEEDGGFLEMSSDQPQQSSRYQLRPRKAIDYVYPALLAVLMAQAGMASTLPSFAGMKPKASRHPGRMCNTSNPVFAVNSERCVNTGMVLQRDKVDGKLCFSELSCPPGQHVMQRGSKALCAPACRCEEWWSFGCSHYHGTSDGPIPNRKPGCPSRAARTCTKHLQPETHGQVYCS